uniref:Uncharacterized protein n=1 Tax=Dulem virus 36 TaxID=3145754 RepID=A0AAU8AZZ5_9CAUD
MNMNPFMLMLQMMQNNTIQNNPAYKRAQEMSRGKTPQQLEQTARNLCQNMGINFDMAWNQFSSQMKQMQGMFGK